jgi:hypothetical protein
MRTQVNALPSSTGRKRKQKGLGRCGYLSIHFHSYRQWDVTKEVDNQ